MCYLECQDISTSSVTVVGTRSRGKYADSIYFLVVLMKIILNIFAGIINLSLAVFVPCSLCRPDWSQIILDEGLYKKKGMISLPGKRDLPMHFDLFFGTSSSFT